MRIRQQVTIQDELIAAVNAAIARWQHRPATVWAHGGHANRTIHAAKRKATRELSKCGLTPAQVADSIKQALDVAELLRLAEDN